MTAPVFVSSLVGVSDPEWMSHLAPGAGLVTAGRVSRSAISTPHIVTSVRDAFRWPAYVTASSLSHERAGAAAVTDGRASLEWTDGGGGKKREGEGV
jgi:hypothetical protein